MITASSVWFGCAILKAISPDVLHCASQSIGDNLPLHKLANALCLMQRSDRNRESKEHPVSFHEGRIISSAAASFPPAAERSRLSRLVETLNDRTIDRES
jgi:hypothetical protein